MTPRSPTPSPGVDSPADAGQTPARRRHADLSQVARGSVLNLVGAVSYGLCNFLLVVIVTRGLGASRAGAFLQAIALFMIFTNTAKLGADTGLVRFIPRFRALGQTDQIRFSLTIALVPVALISTLFGLTLYSFAEPLAQVLGKAERADDIAAYVRLMAPLLPLSTVYTVAVNATRGFETMIPAVVVDKIGKPVIQPLLVFAVIAAGLGPAWLAAAWAVPAGLFVIPALLWLYTLLGRTERRDRGGRGDAGKEEADDLPRSRRATAGEFWRFTAPRAFAGFMQVNIQWLSVLLIGALLSSRLAGIYTASTRYLIIGSFVYMAIVQSVQPKLAGLLARKDLLYSRSVYQTATGWLMALTWPINITLALFAPVLLQIFGAEFTAGQTGLAILAATYLVAHMVGPVDVVLLMGGKSWWSLANMAAALLVNVALNFLLIPRYGINGAAIAWATSILTYNLAPLVQVYALLRIHPFGRGLAHVAPIAGICFGLVGLVLRVVAGATLPVFGLYAVVSTGLYAAVLWHYRKPLDLPSLLSGLRRGRRGAGQPATVAAAAAPTAVTPETMQVSTGRADDTVW